MQRDMSRVAVPWAFPGMQYAVSLARLICRLVGWNGEPLHELWPITVMVALWRISRGHADVGGQYREFVDPGYGAEPGQVPSARCRLQAPWPN